MSHNGRTLSDGMDRRSGVALILAVSPAIDGEMPLLSGPFDTNVEPNLPQPMRHNKTVGLVTWEGADAGGN